MNANNCLDWSSSAMLSFASFGQSDNTFALWIYTAIIKCSEVNHPVYCMQVAAATPVSTNQNLFIFQWFLLIDERSPDDCNRRRHQYRHVIHAIRWFHRVASVFTSRLVAFGVRCVPFFFCSNFLFSLLIAWCREVQRRNVT
jgi:hypothetical protein